MINLKIQMGNGVEYLIKNNFANSPNHWIRIALMPHGTQIRWFEIFPGTIIQTNNIQFVRELTEKEIDNITNPIPEETSEGELPENDLGDKKESGEIEEVDDEGDNNTE